MIIWIVSLQVELRLTSNDSVDGNLPLLLKGTLATLTYKNKMSEMIASTISSDSAGSSSSAEHSETTDRSISSLTALVPNSSFEEGRIIEKANAEIHLQSLNLNSHAQLDKNINLNITNCGAVHIHFHKNE